MREKQPLLKFLKCLHLYYWKELFTTLRILKQFSRLTIADELSRSLHCNWPNTTVLSCIFHVLQQVYERQHGVSKDDRVGIIKLFRKLVYADEVAGYQRTYDDVTL